MCETVDPHDMRAYGRPDVRVCEWPEYTLGAYVAFELYFELYLSTEPLYNKDTLHIKHYIITKAFV